MVAMRQSVFLAVVFLMVEPAWAQFVPGIEYTNQPGLEAINVLPSYNQGYSGAGIRVGIVDSGINPNHVEFTNAIVAGYDAYTGMSSTTNFSFLQNYQPSSGHGSHVAGIVAARLDGNATRPSNMQGVAYNASLVIAAFNNENQTPEQFDAQTSSSLRFAADNGARVINNSWDLQTVSDPAEGYADFSETFPETVKSINYALRKNAVVVFAAGNDSYSNPNAPASTPIYNAEIAQLGGFIAVAATTVRGIDPVTRLPEMVRFPYGGRDQYTNYCGLAKNYCISAPGGGVDQALEGVNSVKATTNDGYVNQSGTSMASPHVTGAVAVVAEKYPWMTNKNLATTILTTGTTAANPSEIWGRGLLDLGKAINGPGIFEDDFEANVTTGYASRFSNDISGTAGIKKLGAGSLELSGVNTFTGKIQINGGTLVANRQSNLGSTTSKVQFGGGTLDLGNYSGDTTFDRQIAVGSGNGWLKASNTLTYTLSSIDRADDGTAGILYFSDKVLSIPGSLALNAYWGGNYTVADGSTLSGTGGVMGDLTVSGTLAPGNSPGTMTVSGNVVQNPGSTLQIQIDGTGTGTGAGNYDRLVLTGPGSTYTAGGTLSTQLRGISGSANNNFSPPLGQGFQIITAPGGILGNFATFVQPTSGLLPGTQFDTVFGSSSLSLYATPSSYSNIAAAGVATNSNRQQIGDILQPIRPTPGVREANTTRKLLFDSLAPQTTSSLSVAMDQLGGVGYGQIIGMNFENSKFLADQTAATVALHRRKEGKHLVAGDTAQSLGEPQEEFWGMAVGRLSDWRGDNAGYNTYDVLGGVMAGIQKRIRPQSLAGFSLAYAGSSPTISQNMGSGPMQNLQLMGYGSHNLDDGFFVQGTLGGGGGSINASRNLSMINTSYNAQIQTANLAGSALAGWGVGTADQIRYETGVGINYLGMRQFAFNDSGSQSAYALTTQAGNTQSLVPNLNATASIPFKAAQIDWRAHGLVNVGYETANNKITLQSNFLGSPITMESDSIGRTRLNLGLGISGDVGRETKIALDISNQSAQNWNATAANVSIRVGF